MAENTKLAIDGYREIPVDAAQKIGDAFDKDIVIITAWDSRHLMIHTTTWGRNLDDKLRAADGGEIVARALGADLDRTTTFTDFRAASNPMRAKIELVMGESWMNAHRALPIGALLAAFVEDLTPSRPKPKQGDWNLGARDV